MERSTRLVGYARPSRYRFDVEEQKRLLKDAGCDEVFVDEAVTYRSAESSGGGLFDQTGINTMIARLGKGDTVVVCRLDRLACSLAELASVLNEMRSRDLIFKSLRKRIDTSAEGGKMIFSIVSAAAQLDRAEDRPSSEAARCFH